MPKKKATPRTSNASSNPRKPPGYWSDFANFEKELRTFIAEHGQKGIMPTGLELNSRGRSDLHRVVGVYGGFPVVAQRLNLERPNAHKPARYWGDFKNVKKELLTFISEHGEEGVMPTVTELANARRIDLVNAIRQHGGTPTVAKRLGLSRPNAKKTPGYWDNFANVQKELIGFISNLGTKGIMPTASELVGNGNTFAKIRLLK